MRKQKKHPERGGKDRLTPEGIMEVRTGEKERERRGTYQSHKKFFSNIFTTT